MYQIDEDYEMLQYTMQSPQPKELYFNRISLIDAKLIKELNERSIQMIYQKVKLDLKKLSKIPEATTVKKPTKRKSSDQRIQNTDSSFSNKGGMRVDFSAINKFTY